MSKALYEIVSIESAQHGGCPVSKSSMGVQSDMPFDTAIIKTRVL